MKKEILRINNLNYRYNSTSRLESISLCILEGECVGFLGLTYSGKDLLVQLLGGENEKGGGKFTVYLEGEKMTGSRQLREKVYHIAAKNYKIDDWTVAEYIGLVDTGWLQMLLHGRVLEEEAGQYFESLSLEFDVSRKIRDLTELEKRIVDLVKALKKGAKLVIIEDEFEGMDTKDIESFAKTMKGLIAGRMSVIVNSHSNMIMHLLSDKYIIFNKGRIVKKCPKTSIKDNKQLERFLLGGGTVSARAEESKAAAEGIADENIVYRVKGLTLHKGCREDFEFVRGKVVTLLVLDSRLKEHIFMTLSGRKTEEDTSYILGQHCYENVSPDLLARKKVVSIKVMGGWDEIFTKMSIGENLLLPSLRKISSLEYISYSGGMEKMAAENMEGDEREQHMLAGSLEINDVISMTLERWYIYNPRVLILFEPFVMCDAYGVSIVKSYIKKFVSRGTAVIMIKSREEYVEDISDQIIRLE